MSVTTVLVTTAHQNQNDSEGVTRGNGNFHPSVWGDRFLNCASDYEINLAHEEQKINELKEEVKRELIAVFDKPSQLLKFIDAIQRLGLAYHFERDIEAALKNLNADTYIDHSEDLAYVSLLFRLLRQEGYHVSPDIFQRFKDDGGTFKQSLTDDIPGMLELYEATHLMVHGEDILEEALGFTTAHLQSVANHSGHPLSAKLIRALKRPRHKVLTRTEAKYHVSIYEKDVSFSKSLLKLAKLDFNLLQSLHMKELCELTRWWKDLDFATKLPFARDRLVECYFWILGVYFEPQYSLARMISTKVIAMISIIDDTYDAYGTFEDLKLFTQAIERWDACSIDQLPDYMKLSYQALLDVYDGIEEEMAKQGKLYCVQYAKEAMKKLVEAYFIEAKWFHQKYIPTMEEYMSNALVSCGYSMVAATSFVGMGDIVTKESFDWVFSNPKIIRASTIICRLMDDIVSHHFEQERGHVASGVECYMKQYGASKQEAYAEFNKQIVNAWKDINEECLKPTQVPMALLTRVVNLSRVMDLLYKEIDGYTHVGQEQKDLVASMLVHPLPTHFI